MRQILPIAGAVVGGMFGAPQLGFAIGSLIGNAVDPLEVQGNKLGDAPTQVAAEGGTRAIVYGKGCVRAVVVIERGGRRVVKQRDQSGKGGPVTVNERALWTYAIGIGEPVGAVLRIWENEKLVYDARPESQIVKDSAEYSKLFRFYDGAEDQLPDPAIEALYSDPTDAPYYRGTAYLVFPQRDLTDFGEAVPTYRVEVAQDVTTNVVTRSALMAVATSIGSDSTTLPSPDGIEWVVAPNPQNSRPFSVVYLCAGNGRYVSSSNGALSVPHVTLDYGETWTPSVGPSYGMRGRPSYIDGRGFFIPCDAGVMHVAEDGMSHSIIAGTGLKSVAATPETVVGWSHYSANLKREVGGVLVDGAEPELSMSGGGDMLYWRGLIYYCGAESSADSPVALRTTVDGTSTSPVTFPDIGINGKGLELAAGKMLDGTEYIVMGTSTGHVLYKKNDAPWKIADWTMPGTIISIMFVGTGFTFVSAAPGYVKYTEDFSSATIQPLTFGFITGHAAALYDAGAETKVGGPIALSTVIAALHDRCGHEPRDYDVDALGELIAGVVIESTQTGAEAINSIIGTHWADPADYDGKIRYIKRGAPVVRTLTIDDLIDEPETWQRNNAIEYPAKMHFFGQIADLAYASVKATSARYSADAKVVGEASVSSPETYNTSHRPYENAAIIHKIMWTEAGGEVTWRVTDQHLDLVPTDCVGLSWGGQLWRARITQIESDPGELKLKMMLDRQSAYTSNLTEVPIPPPVTPPQTSIMADTALAVMDIPALVDAADTLHIVTAMSGETDVWAGANLQRSMDAGASFTPVSSSTLNAIMGTLNVAVTAASPHYTDTTNAIEVLLYTDDEIESLADEVFLSEGGAFALSWDDSGTQRWELMQYRDAELIAHKTYRLTTLHRGRLGTEAAAHPIGAKFVLLDSAIQAHPTQSAWIGQDLTHRAVSTGHTPDDADEQTLTYEGNSQREFPVANLLLSRAGTDVTATVIPRHRFGTDVAPLRSANWDGYRWTATDGTSTITRDGTAYSETFDCTGWASPVTVTVAQLNRITGAGPSVSEGIT